MSDLYDVIDKEIIEKDITERHNKLKTRYENFKNNDIYKEIKNNEEKISTDNLILSNVINIGKNDIGIFKNNLNILFNDIIKYLNYLNSLNYKITYEIKKLIKTNINYWINIIETSNDFDKNNEYFISAKINLIKKNDINPFVSIIIIVIIIVFIIVTILTFLYILSILIVFVYVVKKERLKIQLTGSYSKSELILYPFLGPLYFLF